MQTTIIENFLKAIDQATFQKMMNHLLYLEGYKFIGSPGSVIGKNKTSKGSPDSFFEDGDSFVFCELTTKERLNSGESFFKKLKNDVDHCFNLAKTKIAKERVSKIILAFTEEIKPDELNKLKSKIKTHNPNAELIIYSIQQIPFRILYYPGFAEKYIAGVKTTKGTIYTLPDFLNISKKGLQPSLENPFIGRDTEIKIAKDLLTKNDILILTGTQGVGKSKLAIHLSELFEVELGFEPRIIVSSPVPLWDDLNNFILPEKKYFIVFDDANKALPNLDYLLQFLQGREPNSIKVIITVRDYVRQDIDRYLMDQKFNEITIKSFEDKQIEEIVNKSLPEGVLLDPLILGRIVSLAKGNSRLALMASSSIIENNDIGILKNVNNLYDEYFKKVKLDVSFLNNADSLNGLGILSFFGILDKNNEELKITLENNFGINWNNVWEVYLQLEQVELVDVFSREAVKISDQVLSTYVFYKNFIDKDSAKISYSDWVVKFIDKYEKKINKSLIDIINTFGFKELKDRITSLIIEVQKKLEGNNEKLYKFYEIFWFYREVDTLLFIKKWIESLESEETEIEKIKFSYENNDFVWPSEYLNLLINFWHHSTLLTKEAIEIGLQLVYKQPSRIPELLKHLNEHISYQRFDYCNGYIRQHTLIDTLERDDISERQKLIADQIFLSKAPEFLGWDYSQVEGKGGGQMMIYNFHLIKTNELMQLRNKVLEKLFKLFISNENKVLEAFGKYVWTSRDFDPTIYLEEQQLVTDFFKNNLSSKNYLHCKLVFKYVKTLKGHGIDSINDWSEFINSEPMKIAKIFTFNFDDKRNDLKTREELKKREIEILIADKDILFIENIFKMIENICSDKNSFTDQCLNYLFNAIAEKDAKMFLRTLELIMLGNYKFELNYGSIIFDPIRKKIVPIKELYNQINRYEYKQKQFWKQMFFEAIEEDEIDEFILQEFIGFLFSINENFYLNDFDKYDKFTKQFIVSQKKLPPSAFNHLNVITYITEILLSRNSEIKIFFGHHICEKCSNFFKDKLSLLKRLFFYHKTLNEHYDYDGLEMAAISSGDHYFVLEYLNEVTKDKTHVEFNFDNLNLFFIWDFVEYEDILDKSIEMIISKAPVWSNFEHQVNVLFNKMKLQPEQQEKVYQYISNFIKRNFSLKQHILVIMNVVTYSFNDQVLRFLREFLLLNKNVEFLRSMWLETNEGSSGSRVPIIDAHINFTKQIIEMVKALPNPLDYDQHLKHWEQELEWAQKDKQQEMKRDFAGWGD